MNPTSPTSAAYSGQLSHFRRLRAPGCSSPARQFPGEFPWNLARFEKVAERRENERPFNAPLELAWGPAAAEVSVVCVSMGSPRKFTLLRFSGETDILHRTHRDKAGHAYRESCATQARAHAITDLSIESFNVYYRATLSLCCNQSFAFYFDALSTRRRAGRAEEIAKGAWQYYDAQTGQPIDFDHPFG